ncbi:hypothetical protein ACDA63_00700 [Uliginosibacterium sp. sgz301328]|uniref:hypothetical protein n=1 Tax=Uliginosibacterium sp. sgz301328 TaxID=3243764 RepID=UPI00359E62F3
MRKKTVLIVGGHRRMGSRLSAMAEDMGLDVVGLVSPAHALRVARSCQPDLVLVDQEGSRVGLRGMGAALLDCLVSGRVLLLAPQICSQSIHAQGPSGVVVMTRSAPDESVVMAVRSLLGLSLSTSHETGVAPADMRAGGAATLQDRTEAAVRRSRQSIALRRTGFRGARVAFGIAAHGARRDRGALADTQFDVAALRGIDKSVREFMPT